MNDGDLIFDTRVDTSGLQQGMDEARRQTNNLSGTAQTALGNLAASAARDIANTVKDAFTTAAKFVVETGKSFESSMSQVSATMGITTASKDYEMLSAAAKEMGATTKYSATQAGEALNYLALAGYSAENSVKALPTVLNVASAGGMELAQASDMITDSMSALGLEMKDLESFSDKLAKTSQRSNTSVAQLGEAILTVGGTAKSLSGGVDELNTMLGLIADNGIKGAEGGTALRNIILSLSAPTDTAAAAMDNLRTSTGEAFSAFDENGNLRELSDVFGDLNDALAPLTEQEKTQGLNEIFNKVDLKAVNALLGTSTKRFEELRGEIENCEGAAAQMAETMSDNLEGDLQIMNSSLEAVGNSAYEKFSGPMRTAVQEITGIFDRLNQSINGELGIKLETLAEKLGDIAIKAAEFAVDEGIPKLIDALGWICDHSDELLTAAESAAAMVIAYKGLTAVSTAAGAISSLASAVAGGATAFEALGIAMGACPWVAIGALAIGAGVAVRNYIEKQRELIGYEGDIKEAYNEANKEIAIQNGLLAELSGSNNSDDKRKAYEEAKADVDTYSSMLAENEAKLRGIRIAKEQAEAELESFSDPSNFTAVSDEEIQAVKERLEEYDQEIAGINEQNIFLENALIARKNIVEKYNGPIPVENKGVFYETYKKAKDALDDSEQKTASAIASQEELTQELADSWAELDHKYAMGIISSDSELYSKRLELLSQYGDSSNKEHWKYYEQIKAYEKQQNEKRLEEDKKAADERQKEEDKRIKKSEDSLKKSLDDINATYREKYSELESFQSNYRSKLMSIGGEIFTVEVKEDENGQKTKEYKINDIDAQIKKMQAYHEDIKKLKEDGANQALLSELMSLSGEDAMGMADYIASLSEAERKAVIELYKQKEAAADELSADLYAKDAQDMQDAFASALTNLGINSFKSGITAAEQFASGFNGTLSELIDVSAIVTQRKAASSASAAGQTAKGNSDTNVNVEMVVTGGDVKLDGNSVGEYSLDYNIQTNTQKGK